ncbi:MAG: ABC transporter ATP-binding protein [Spirochaetae bacterium HGW-Spirochaetae-5]|nr:MAG: ABC transporter ATP-binding protein [Spirochaetae bacterium HGW-Spirochaetae-5]
MIEIRSVSRRYPGAEILKDISFKLEKGESLSIIGPSGCGKTTILYMIAGLIPASSGIISLNGREIKEPHSQTAFILQDYGLLPWKTVIENVSLGMKIKKYPREKASAVSERILKDLGIYSHKDKYPATLSGGEKQRVAIARALSTEPEILLMDEPFSSLDTLTREKLQQTIYEIHEKRSLTLITVTHSIEEAVFLGDTILVMNGKPGRVISTVSNSSRRKKDFRNSKEFYSICSTIREMIGNI